MFFEKDSLWVAAGDSITEGGRNMNAKVWDADVLGSGFVYFLNAALTGFFPEKKIRVINRGVGGDTSSQLLARWKDDVLSLRPDYLSLMVGINDVWRHFDSYGVPEELISIEQYAENCRQMIETALPVVKKIWVMPPFMFECSLEDAMCRKVREYAEVLSALASELNVPCVDLQSAVDKALKSRHSCVFSADRVHPNAAGHMILAGELWRFFTQQD
ncbi:MAG: SGNH/GDSL hydrolase family protein [Spirochaetaceae bacterium]|nr:SGNH/GDSL hydrolase family protein [Spirochaetaceae bacterium]